MKRSFGSHTFIARVLILWSIAKQFCLSLQSFSLLIDTCYVYVTVPTTHAERGKRIQGCKGSNECMLCHSVHNIRQIISIKRISTV